MPRRKHAAKTRKPRRKHAANTATESREIEPQEIPDLILSTRDAGEGVDEEALDPRVEFQNTFFAPSKCRSTGGVAPAGPKAKAKGRAKNMAKGKAKRTPGKPVTRASAHRFLRALDFVLKQTLGQGLALFTQNDLSLPLHNRPLLVLLLDEGSIGVAASWYLTHKLGARVVLLRDLFHREWNDIKDAIKSSGLWYVVLLSNIVFNLCYGPWEGSAWYEKLVAGATELFAKETVANPLFQSLYPMICNDHGDTAVGTYEHRSQVLTATANAEAFKRKGPRCTMRRFFSWSLAAEWHLQEWRTWLQS